jgi:hypothetical protein
LVARRLRCFFLLAIGRQPLIPVTTK